MNKIIRAIEILKLDLMSMERVNLLLIKKAYFDIVNSLVAELETKTNEELDLRNLVEVHQYLINKVIDIHKKEYSEKNIEILSKHDNIRKASRYLEKNKRAHNIYYLNGDEKYYFIGDLHSDVFTLKNILDKVNFFEELRNNDFKLVFLGDYVDRGKNHLDVISYLLTLKYLFPNNIILLRGNHDDYHYLNEKMTLLLKQESDIENENDFSFYINNLIIENKTFDNKIGNSYLNFFNSLATVAFIKKTSLVLMAVHAGIARPNNNTEQRFGYIECLADLNNTEIIDVMTKSIVDNILWSYPVEESSIDRYVEFKFPFNEEDFDYFQEKIGFDKFVCANETSNSGKSLFSKRLYSVFSTGKIIENTHNVNKQTYYDNINPSVVLLEKKSLKTIYLNQ